MEENARNAVLYARLSLDAQKTGSAVQRQLEDARKLAEMRGFNVVAEHVDNDISAAGKKVRPGFNAMIADLAEGRAEVVVAWAWDRLSRNRRDTLRLIEVGQEAHATVALVKGSDVDMSTAAGRLVADLFAGMSRAEIDTKSERQQRAGQQRAEKGLPPARRAFGYRQDGAIDLVEGPVVADLYAKLLGGATVSGLTRSLTASGHKSVAGTDYSRSGVNKLLLNPRYAGLRVYRGEIVGEGVWEPIVSLDTYEAAKAMLTDPARKRTRPARRWLGSSLYRCWCGAPVFNSYVKANSRVYKCTASAHMSRKADPIDATVDGVVAKRLREQDLAEVLRDDKSATAALGLRHDALGLRQRLDALATDYADGNLTARQVQVASARIDERLADVESQLAVFGKRSALAEIAGTADPGASWLALPLDRKRAVIDAVCTVVILRGLMGRLPYDPETVRFDWKA